MSRKNLFTGRRGLNFGPHWSRNFWRVEWLNVIFKKTGAHVGSRLGQALAPKK